MGARLIHHLSECGLTVRTGNNGLIVEPRNLITDPLRLFIRENKAEIMAELLAANDDEHTIESKPTQELAPVLCIACQHYRFGYDHMGNVARCMASGGFRGAVIERPELRRECSDYVQPFSDTDTEGGPQGLLTADGLIEPDVPAVTYDPHDNRRRCCQCLNLASTGRCLAASRGELPSTSRHYSPPQTQTRLLRCEGYQPGADDPDQRQGRHRWRGMFD